MIFLVLKRHDKQVSSIGDTCVLNHVLFVIILPEFDLLDLESVEYIYDEDIVI